MTTERQSSGSVFEAIVGAPLNEELEHRARRAKAKTTVWTSLALFSIVATVCAIIILIQFTAWFVRVV